MNRHEMSGRDDRIRYSLSQEMMAILTVGVVIAGILLAEIVAMRAERAAWCAVVRTEPADVRVYYEAVCAETQSDWESVGTGLIDSSSNSER